MKLINDHTSTAMKTHSFHLTTLNPLTLETLHFDREVTTDDSGAIIAVDHVVIAETDRTFAGMTPVEAAIFDVDCHCCSKHQFSLYETDHVIEPV